MILRSVSLFRRGKQTWREVLLWVVVWGGIGFVGVFPEVIDMVPPYIGIKSGVNVLVFFGFVVLFYGVFRLVVKMEALERKIVEMSRARALKESDADDKMDI